jgi:hypothetical protein
VEHQELYQPHFCFLQVSCILHMVSSSTRLLNRNQISPRVTITPSSLSHAVMYTVNIASSLDYLTNSLFKRATTNDLLYVAVSYFQDRWPRLQSCGSISQQQPVVYLFTLSMESHFLWDQPCTWPRLGYNWNSISLWFITLIDWTDWKNNWLMVLIVLIGWLIAGVLVFLSDWLD